MTERWTTSKDKLARAAAVSGLAAGLTATSLIGGPTANAWCVGISGINIGAGCASTLGNIALGLGPNAVANSNGLSLAVALGGSCGLDGRPHPRHGGRHVGGRHERDC